MSEERDHLPVLQCNKVGSAPSYHTLHLKSHTPPQWPAALDRSDGGDNVQALRGIVGFV